MENGNFSSSLKCLEKLWTGKFCRDVQHPIRRKIEITHWKKLDNPCHSIMSLDFSLSSMVVGPGIWGLTSLYT